MDAEEEARVLVLSAGGRPGPGPSATGNRHAASAGDCHELIKGYVSPATHVGVQRCHFSVTELNCSDNIPFLSGWGGRGKN